jgi:membrane-bound lytic murein transglycosylase D
MARILLYIILSTIASCLLAQSIDNPQQPEYLYVKRIEKLDQASPIKLEYNKHVRAYIDVYTERRREHLSAIIARSELYFPMFEEYLAKYNLPLELKYLAIVESALDPTAKSSSGAMGLWQFLYNAGRMFGLNVTSYEDERCDPEKSTDAACRYLAYLYQNLNDWQLALAAYNGGIGEIQKAMERSGGKKNYWELRPYLPDQVKGYVPAFIAVNYVMNHYKSHNIKPAPIQLSYADTDTVTIYRSLTFTQIANASGASIETICMLNPSYTKEMVPAYGNPVKITLPRKNIIQFIREEKRLNTANKPEATIGAWRQPAAITVYHTVARGEYFHSIAMKYQTTVEQIMKWNNLKSKNLQTGQQLKIYHYPKADPFFFVSEEKT